MSLGRKKKRRTPKRDKHGRFLKKKSRRAKRKNPSQAKQLSEVKKKLAQLSRAKYQAGKRGGIGARAKAASALSSKQKALEARMRKLESSERIEGLEEQLAALKGKKGKTVAKKKKAKGGKKSKKAKKAKKAGRKKGKMTKAQRSAAGKKAARTRKRNKAKKAAARKGKSKSHAKKHNPSRKHSRKKSHKRSRKHSRRRRRHNPEGVGMKKIESYLGHDMKEVGGLLIGGAIFGTVTGLAARIPVVNQVQAVLNKVPVIGASLPALLIGVAGHMLAEKQKIKPLEMVSEGLIAASLVSMGVSAAQLVPGLSLKPATQAGLLIAPRGAGDFGNLPQVIRGRADFGAGDTGQLGNIEIYNDRGMSGDWQMAGAEEEQLG